jgi:Bacterial TSP3 repeat
MMLLVRCLFILGFLVATPFTASASPSYSRVLQSSLELPCEPSCTLCHTSPAGGFATANTKFGINMRRVFHAACCDGELMRTIAEQLEVSGLDSDGDGLTDVDELRATTDPNSAEIEAELACEAPPDGGCALTGAGRKQGGGALIVLLGLLALPICSRLGRARPGKSPKCVSVLRS